MSQADGMQKIQQANDEIDLRDLIVALWNGRWLITGVTALVAAIALAYLLLIPQSQKASMVIKPLDSFEADSYRPLTETEMLQVDAELLQNIFFEVPELFLADNIVKVNYIEPLENETQSELLLRAGAVASSFEFIAPDMEAKIKQPHWTLNFTTDNPPLARQLIDQTFADITAEVQTRLQAQFAFNIEEYKTRLADQIQDIDIQIASAEQAYEASRSREIALLGEQAAIAREADIAENQMISNINGNGDMVLLSQSMPMYLNGYRALEKEMDLLGERSSARDYLPAEVDKLFAQKYKLVNDQMAQRAQQRYELTPLAGDNFQAVNYQMINLEIKPKQSWVLILMLVILLGGMLGTIILVFRNALNGDRQLA